jgi:hypothetical protein
MSRSLSNVGWVTRNDGDRDQRFTMPQVLNADGSRDRRFGLLEQPRFGSSEILTQGRSQYYDPTNAHNSSGKYNTSLYHSSYFSL